jgi:hypothetical protein
MHVWLVFFARAGKRLLGNGLDLVQLAILVILIGLVTRVSPATRHWTNHVEGALTCKLAALKPGANGIRGGIQSGQLQKVASL